MPAAELWAPPLPSPVLGGGLEQSPSPRCVSVSLFGERGCWGPRPAPMAVVGRRGSRASRGRSRARPTPADTVPVLPATGKFQTFARVAFEATKNGLP